jgi:hypothetical protein
LGPDLATDAIASAPANGPPLLLVTVTGCAVPAVPDSWFPKFKPEGTEIPGSVAVPNKETIGGLSPVMFSVAERIPVGAEEPGLNETPIWQDLPAPKLGAHEFPSSKSPEFAPVTATPLIPAGAPPSR